MKSKASVSEYRNPCVLHSHYGRLSNLCMSVYIMCNRNVRNAITVSGNGTCKVFLIYPGSWEPWLRRRLHDNASYEYGGFSISFHRRGAAFARSCFLSFYEQKLIMHVECGHAIFGKHSKFSMMRFRKCNLVLIDIKVGLLLTFLASMTAKVRLYQKHVSVFGCLHVKKLAIFQVSVFKVSTDVSGFKSVCFEYAFSSFACKWKAKTVTNYWFCVENGVV